MSRVVIPTYCARVRSISTAMTGALRDCWIRASTMPGTCRMRASSRLACSKPAVGSELRTCTSIGEGAPKFRIWLMMSAGRNEKETRGKLPAQFAHIVGGRRMLLGQLDLDVAVLAADRAGVVVGHVDAADRHADIVGHGRDIARRREGGHGRL